MWVPAVLLTQVIDPFSIRACVTALQPDRLGIDTSPECTCRATSHVDMVTL